MYWYGDEDGHFLRTLEFEVEGQGKKWRPNMIYKRQVDEECIEVGLRRKDGLFQSMYIAYVNQIFNGMR